MLEFEQQCVLVLQQLVAFFGFGSSALSRTG